MVWDSGLSGFKIEGLLLGGSRVKGDSGAFKAYRRLAELLFMAEASRTASFLSQLRHPDLATL